LENGKLIFNPSRIKIKSNGICYSSILNILVKVIFYPEGQAFVYCRSTKGEFGAFSNKWFYRPYRCNPITRIFHLQALDMMTRGHACRFVTIIGTQI
jgi:NADH:ubiquinone oxidoreductase subunit D